MKTKYRILVADDNSFMRDFVQKELSGKGYQVKTVEDGSKAISALKKEEYDIFLTDLEMPSLNGIAAIRAAKKISPDVISIIMTGYASLESSIQGLKLGAYDYLIKPFSAELLHLVVEKGIYKKKIEEENKELVEELKLANKELKEQNEKLEIIQHEMIEKHKLASVGQLAGGIAHEINNPLGAVSTYNQLMIRQLEQGAFDKIKGLEDFKKYLHQMDEEINRIAKTVTNLLVFARRKEFKIDLVDINKVVQDTIELTYYQSSKNNIEIVSKLASNLPFISADGEKLQEALVNIIVNAIQSMPDGGQLNISSKAVGMDKNKKTKSIQLTFSDTGNGINKDDLEKLFNPFFTTKKVGAGVGLGLSISYSIIDKHNGNMQVESKVGKGTKFIINLPVHGQS